MKFSMKRRRFADVPLVYKIAAAPVLAMVILLAVVGSAALVQQRQTLVIRDTLRNDALERALTADSEQITAVNEAFFRLMAQQQAGGSTQASRQAVTRRLAALDAIKAELVRLRPALPRAQRHGIDTVLQELVNLRGPIQFAGSMPGADFYTHANAFPPYAANYLRMTASLQAASAKLAAAATAQASKNARQTAMIRKLMFAFAAAMLVLVTGVEWLILTALRMIAMRQQQEAMEITSRMHQARLVRMISVLSETNEAILRAETRQKLFDLVCTAAASGGNFLLTIVLQADRELKHLRIVSAAGRNLDVEAALRTEFNAGDPEFPETAMRTGKPAIYNDYLTEQQTDIHFEEGQKLGVRSKAFLPLFSRGQTVGAIVFAAEEPNMFSPDFVELLQQLAGNLSFALENFEKAAERERAEARIKYLATHDSLTALPNRAMFHQLLSFAIATARRYERQCAVLFIDLDRFKLINDSLGHAAGDALLVEMAARLNNVVRASDVVARLGGDEFVVLLNEITGTEQAVAVAHNLLSAFREPLDLNGHECRITGSIGIAMFPDDGPDEQTLMKNADIAMYLAKAEGKNDVRMFSAAIETPSLERLDIESSLRHALERDELRLDYQPKVDVVTGRIVGVEALLRWMHPKLGMLAPRKFIPVAEETGLIVMIGRWVLNTACAQNMEWQRAGLPPISMAVNVSPRQFSDEQLLNSIDHALASSGLDPKLLQIEITESMVMLNVERAIRVLDAIQSRGLRIAIDDFGAGYSSMSMLKRFPIDTIKIDRSFVSDLPDSSQDKAIAEAIINLGKALGLTVVAEGVETAAQDKFLRDHACDEIQGFLFSQPVQPEKIVELLTAMPERDSGNDRLLTV